MSGNEYPVVVGGLFLALLQFNANMYRHTICDGICRCPPEARDPITRHNADPLRNGRSVHTSYHSDPVIGGMLCSEEKER